MVSGPAFVLSPAANELQPSPHLYFQRNISASLTRTLSAAQPNLAIWKSKHLSHVVSRPVLPHDEQTSQFCPHVVSQMFSDPTALRPMPPSQHGTEVKCASARSSETLCGSQKGLSVELRNM
jgi:hypothetical protein